MLLLPTATQILLSLLMLTTLLQNLFATAAETIPFAATSIIFIALDAYTAKPTAVTSAQAAVTVNAAASEHP